MKRYKWLGLILIGLLIVGITTHMMVLRKTIKLNDVLSHQLLAWGRVLGGVPTSEIFTDYESFSSYRNLQLNCLDMMPPLSLDPILFEEHFIILIYAYVESPADDIVVRAYSKRGLQIHHVSATPPAEEIQAIPEMGCPYYVLLQVEKPKHPRNYFVQFSNGVETYYEGWIYIE